MHEEIIFSGFGGQGALFAGQLLAYAALDAGLHVTWIPSYGPEMRGGTAHCTVVVSDEPIGSPLVTRPGAVVALNLPSFEKYEPLVRPGGLMVYNSSLIERQTATRRISVTSPCRQRHRRALGNVRQANVVLAGRLSGGDRRAAAGSRRGPRWIPICPNVSASSWKQQGSAAPWREALAAEPHAAHLRSTRRLSHGHTLEEPLRPAHPAHGPLDHPRAAEIHAAARHHLVCRRSARAGVVPDRAAARRRPVGCFRSMAPQALQYGPTEGFLPLRQFICDRMTRYGIRRKPANVVITNGSQQALDLIGKLLINPGDRILVEEPTYLGALQAWNAYQAEYERCAQ